MEETTTKTKLLEDVGDRKNLVELTTIPSLILASRTQIMVQEFIFPPTPIFQKPKLEHTNESKRNRRYDKILNDSHIKNLDSLFIV